MNLIMVGVDFHNADIGIRELFSFSAEAAQEYQRQLCQFPGIRGCVLLSTCNRTELYLSCDKEGWIDPIRTLCHSINTDIAIDRKWFRILHNHDVIEHLMMVTSGLYSKVRGENQILGQVKKASALAREIKCTDPYLEVIFRNAISAGKKHELLSLSKQ